MLPSQRDAFDIPRDVCYLNAASWSPLPRKVQEAGHEGVDRKARPWAVDPGLARAQHERTRAAAAALIGADANEVAERFSRPPPARGFCWWKMTIPPPCWNG